MSKTTTKKSTARKPASPRSTRPRASQRKPAERRDPQQLIRIGITPPSMSDDSEARRVDEQLANQATRPGPIALSKLPWLRQNVAYRVGYYMLTHGLREHANHPEIEVCNVPGVYVRETGRILNHIADYVLNSGGVLKAGETMLLSPDDDPFMAVVSFRRIRPGQGGMDHGEDVLRVLFLR